jgi:general secretion pathway protein G
VRKAHDDQGWTLLEVMAVVLILGILVAIAVGSYTLATDRARIVACQSNQRVLNTAVVTYEQDHDGAPPPDLDALRPYVAGQEYKKCPSGADLTYDPATGHVSCPIHPPQ